MQSTTPRGPPENFGERVAFSAQKLDLGSQSRPGNVTSSTVGVHVRLRPRLRPKSGISDLSCCPVSSSAARPGRTILRLNCLDAFREGQNGAMSCDRAVLGT